MKECKKRANEKFLKKCKRYQLAFNPENSDEAKVIDQLEKQDNKKDYIKKLIIKDIAK